MKSDSSESEIRQFYADATLPEDRIDAILSHGHSVASARLWKQVAVASGLAFTGMTLVCMVLFIRLQDQSRIAVAPVELRPAVAEETAAPSNDGTGVIASDGQRKRQRFQLIGVRSHGDRCPHCQASGEVFAKLKESFSNEPIEFTFIDLRRDSESLEESQQTFDSLELDGLVEGRDKALIAVADPAGGLHKLDAGLGADQLKRQIETLFAEK